MPVVFEMETSGPDDFMTLLFLADHRGSICAPCCDTGSPCLL
jgi:hypothetical protein